LSRARRGRAAWAAILGFVGVAAALLATPVLAEQRPAVIVTPGKSQTFKAALQRFADVSGVASDERTIAFRKALSVALEYSSVFLVQGEIQVDASRYSAEFRLWDTARCKSLIRKRYRQDAKLDPNLLAKRIADDIVAAFIGVRGVASTELVYVSDRSGAKEIYVMNADGGAQRAVTANRSINNFPAWSPDGDSIVFTSYRHRNQPTLFVTTRGQGKPQRLLTGFDPDRSQYRGVFDPIGRSLAVVMSDGGPSEIYTVRPSARKVRRITKNSVIDISPSWSPNGKQLAYVSDRSGSPQVYVMDPDGKNSRRLTFNGSYNTAPSWSPDGKWIAYETRVGGQFDIWLIDPEGTVNVPLITHPRSDEAPAWSPNSRKLAFSSTRRGRADIYIVDVGGGKPPRRLTVGAGNNTSPAWGP